MTIGLIVSVSHHLPLCVNCVFGYRIVWSSNLPDKQPATSCVPDRVAGWLAVNFMVNYARRLRYLTFCATLIEALTIPPSPSLPACVNPVPRAFQTAPVLSDSVRYTCVLCVMLIRAKCSDNTRCMCAYCQLAKGGLDLMMTITDKSHDDVNHMQVK